MGALTVSLAAARAWVWQKHGLGPVQHRDPFTASDASAAVYCTSPTCALSLAARVDGFRLADLEAELATRRRLVRIGCLRGSGFAMPVERLGAAIAVNLERRRKAHGAIVRGSGVSDAEYPALRDAAMDVLAKGPATTADVATAVGPLVDAHRRAFRYVIGMMSIEGLIVLADEVDGLVAADGARAIAAEAARVAECLGLGEVAVRHASSPLPLTIAGQNTFMHPVRHLDQGVCA